MNLYNATKFSLYCSLLFISSTKKISGFTLVLPLRIIFDFFFICLFSILRISQLPFAANLTLNRSNFLLCVTCTLHPDLKSVCF